MSDDRPGFLSRWSRRKHDARREEDRNESQAHQDESLQQASIAQAVPLADRMPSVEKQTPDESPAAQELHTNTAGPAPSLDSSSRVTGATPSSASAQEQTPEQAPALTLNDVASLTADSDYSAFVARDVAPDVKNAALKKLFTDPHYNVMDGLDIYIDDYSNQEVMPASMLRQLASARVMNLFDDDEEETGAELPATPSVIPTEPHVAPEQPTTPPSEATLLPSQLADETGEPHAASDTLIERAGSDDAGDDGEPRACADTRTTRTG